MEAISAPAQGYNANIHQTMENEEGIKAVHDVKVRWSPQSMILSRQGKDLSKKNIKP